MEGFTNYGRKLTYKVTNFFNCGLQYENYFFWIFGDGILKNPNQHIRPEFSIQATFKQLKLVTEYNYDLNNIKIISNINFTIYSIPNKKKDLQRGFI